MIFIFLSLLTLLLYISTRNRPNSKWPSVLMVLTYVVVFSMRGMGVADTEPYYEVYTGFFDYGMEVGYLFLNLLFRNWGVTFRGFLFFVAIFDLFLWYHYTKKTLNQNNILIPLALFMSNMGMIYYGIVLRSGMANAIMMIPISYMLLLYESEGRPVYSSGKKIKILFKILFLFGGSLFVAGLFHQSIYVIIIAIVLYYFPFSKKVQYAFLVIALIIGSISFIPQLISSIVQPILEDLGMRMSDRLNRDVSQGISLYQIINVCIGFIYINWGKYIKDPGKQKQYQFILNIYIFGVFMSGAFSYLTAGSRIGHLLIFYEFFIPALLLSNVTNKVVCKKITLVILLIILFNFLRNFYGIPSLIDYIS